jgi:hypothetical protein
MVAAPSGKTICGQQVHDWSRRFTPEADPAHEVASGFFCRRIIYLDQQFGVDVYISVFSLCLSDRTLQVRGNGYLRRGRIRSTRDL